MISVTTPGAGAWVAMVGAGAALPAMRGPAGSLVAATGAGSYFGHKRGKAISAVKPTAKQPNAASMVVTGPMDDLLSGAGANRSARMNCRLQAVTHRTRVKGQFTLSRRYVEET